jgi:hypothetical protein
MRHLALLASLLSAGCALDARGGKIPISPPPGIAVADGAPKAPLHIRWRVLSDEDGRLQIEAILERRVRLDAPIGVRVEVPSGLRLVSGQTSFQVPAQMQPGETKVLFEFSHAGPPPEDLKVVADSTGASMGVHASDSYRFGRPEPKSPRPRPEGPSIVVGDKDLGPAIPLDAH